MYFYGPENLIGKKYVRALVRFERVINGLHQWISRGGPAGPGPPLYCSDNPAIELSIDGGHFLVTSSNDVWHFYFLYNTLVQLFLNQTWRRTPEGLRGNYIQYPRKLKLISRQSDKKYCTDHWNKLNCVYFQENFSLFWCNKLDYALSKEYYPRK